MPPLQTRDTKPRRRLILILAAQLAFIAAVHTASSAGWGWGRTNPSGSTGVGWLANRSDSFFYDSWLQQAANGHALFSVLYTTTPHPAAYFNPALLAAGLLARVAGGRAEGWFILMGIAAALVLTWAVHRIARTLGFGERAANWAALFAAFGSGWSWLLKLWNHFAGPPPLLAADLKFMDLIPSSSALIYPLHTIGQALVALALLLLVRQEQDLAEQAPVRGRAALIVVLALLAATRPYEPLALVLATLTYVGALSFLARSWRPLRARLALLACGAVAIGPFLGWAAWLSRQPVWSNFARLALNQGHPPWFWICGFGGLGVLGLAGGIVVLRTNRGPALLPALWATAGIVLCTSAEHGAKLLSGVGIPLCICAGLAMGGIQDWIGSRLRSGRGSLLVAGLLATLLAGPLTLLVIAREAILYPPLVDTDTVRLAEVLRKATGGARDLVLCDPQVGKVLPGLAGVRVYAGHWALTDEYTAKVGQLKAAGFPGLPGSPSPRPSEGRSIGALIRATNPRWVVVDADSALLPRLRAIAGVRTLYSGPGRVLLRLPRQGEPEPR